MEKVEDILHVMRQEDGTTSDALYRRFGPPGKKDIVLQLGGNDPNDVQECVERLLRSGYSFNEINLNCGCPSIEKGGAKTFGASLMKEPDLTARLLEAMRAGIFNSDVAVGNHIDVSLKCRIAVYDTPEEMSMFARATTSAEDDYSLMYENLHHYISHAVQADAGLSHMILHARPVVLGGMSPTKNRQVPELNYDIVHQIANDFPGLDVTLNGGIKSMDELNELHLMARNRFRNNDAHGHHEKRINMISFMAGRWMLRRPLDIIHIRDVFGDNSRQYASGDRVETLITNAISQYMDYIDGQLKSSNKLRVNPLSELCLPLYLVSEQLREDYKEFYSGVDLYDSEGIVAGITVLRSDEEFEAVYSGLRDVAIYLSELGSQRKKSTKGVPPEEINWKKLSLFFQGVVGKKIGNKWKKNRAEL